MKKKKIYLRKQNPKIILYRILGNDLPPRHKAGQTYNNLKFILENEPMLMNCEKKWIINRIINSNEEKRIINLLEKYEQHFIRIPFDIKEYKDCGKDGSKKFGSEKHEKILYFTNINRARNLALREGKKKADWILPFDSNCCFNRQGWERIVDKLSVQKATDKYFAVPMYRLTNNKQCFNINIKEYRGGEPQIIFGKNTNEEFDENFRYGEESKVQMLKRLFEIEYIDYLQVVADSKSCVGYVLRLFSGIKKGEKSQIRRNILRNSAINLMILKLDKLVLGRPLRFFKLRILLSCFSEQFLFLKRYILLLPKDLKRIKYELWAKFCLMCHKLGLHKIKNWRKMIR